MPQPTQARQVAQRPSQSTQQRAPRQIAPPQEEDLEDQQDADEELDDQGGWETDDNSSGEDFDFDSMVLDLESAEEPVREVWKPGTYPGVITDVQPSVSQAKGNPMLVWEIEIHDPRDEEKTRNVRYYTVLTGEAAGRTKRAIKRVAPDLDLTQFRPSDAGDLLSNLECRVVLRIGRYQGEKTNNVSDLLAPLGDYGE